MRYARSMSPHVVGKLLVTLQFGLLVVLFGLCLLRVPDQFPGPATYALWFAGITLGLWALRANRPGNFNIRPEPKAQGLLVQSGPYRWVRHPMYSAVLLLAAGASAWLMTLVGLVLWVDLLGVLLAKAYLEEKWLLLRYTEYAKYRQQTWRLVPWIY